MNSTCRWLAVLAVIIVAAAPAFATGGAWNREEEGYFVKIGLTSTSADEEYGFDGNLYPIFGDTSRFIDGNYGITDITIYGEYGITDWLTGVASTQYKVAVKQAEYRPTSRDTSASASGLGDLWLGARIRLLPRDEPVVASLTLGWKLPTGSPLQEIPLGTGVVDYEASFAVGTSFPVKDDIYGYAQLSTGFRLRNSASNEVNYLAEVGVNLSPELMVQALFDGTASTADFDRAATEAAATGRAVAFERDQSFNRWSFGMIYQTSETMALNLGYGWSTSGRNALSASGISIGVSWKK